MDKEFGNLPKCYGCYFFLLKDYGYSDYTVEGTMVECLKSKFEERERAYDSCETEYAEQNGYLAAAALNCTDYRPGDGLTLNVECDGDEIEKHLAEAPK